MTDNKYDTLDIREIEDVSLTLLAKDFPKYQLDYKTILCTEKQYDDFSSIFHDYERDGSWRLRGVPLVTKKRPLKFSSTRLIANIGT